MKYVRKYWYLFPLVAVLSWLFATYRRAEATRSPASQQAPSAVSPPEIPAIITTGLKDSVFPRIFEAAFYPGTTASDQDDETVTWSFEKFDCGKLNVESGKLIACDPINMTNAAPFVQKFPLGDFPVQLAIRSGDGDQTVAFSRIVFSEAPVVRWEVALQPGEKPQAISAGRHYCYSVDAATGLYIDSAANAAFDGSTYEQVFIRELTKNQRPHWSHVLHGFGTHNLAAFSTGHGDGCYSVYIGFDTQGHVCRLLTDFGLVAW